MNIPKQTCWACRFFTFDYEGDYSELTLGAGLTLTCGKSHYYVSGSSTQEEFGKAMQFGFTCPDYKRRGSEE